MDNLITSALAETKETPLSFLCLAKLAGYTDQELRYTKLFWDESFNPSWLYLSDEYIKEWLTNEVKKIRYYISINVI